METLEAALNSWQVYSVMETSFEKSPLPIDLAQAV